LKEKEMRKDKFLLSRHTPKGIGFIYYVVRSGKVPGACSKTIKETVARLYANNPISKEAKPIYFPDVPEAKWPRLDDNK
jgi:hypothetical protein